MSPGSAWTPAGRRPNGIRADDPQPDYALGLRRAKASTLLMLGLPGSAYLYQGEELGLPDHTSLDDDLRQDPTWWRSEYTEAGRDGCRVPLPWESDAPGPRFRTRAGRPGCRSRIPTPSWPATGRPGVEGSTLEMYQSALALRRAFKLGAGSLEWGPIAAPTSSRYTNGEVTVVDEHGCRTGAAARRRGADGLRRADRATAAAGRRHRLARLRRCAPVDCR